MQTCFKSIEFFDFSYNQQMPSYKAKKNPQCGDMAAHYTLLWSLCIRNTHNFIVIFLFLYIHYLQKHDNMYWCRPVNFQYFRLSI